MNSSRYLLYVSNLPPGEGQGGRIIVDRHLRRLAQEGWTITVVTTAHDAADGPWKRIVLPQRRWWWPPFRADSPWLAKLRSLAWAREIPNVRPNVVLTVCWGSLSWLAAHVANTFKTPLVAIVHDHWRETGNAADSLVAEHTCRCAEKIFAVSDEMRASLEAQFGPGKAETLPPIPAARERHWAEWRSSHAACPVVAHVGALHPYHAPFLERVAREIAAHNGRLLVLCATDNPVLATLRARIPNLDHQPLFATNREAVEFVARQVAGIVIMYPEGSDADGRVPTGFPSRFIEFSQTGLPILLAAPQGNPVRSWAQSHDWPAQFDPTDHESLHTACAALADEASWSRYAEATRAAASGAFDADRIQHQFSTTLERLAAD